ncbi:uncharacterized protein LOC108435312 [Pygocentrus nattereri]|uniref:uncharacterized protein LOC108435312 n=1 Tax=Pygocentrus nattereri TaxID=42514 RepID=UPI0008149FBE|nr:uncharacterized protein LOC108435312 [Pygocentrus nattereri]XP_037396123.1 uncharacterized protein LOC108435312 [Pygocentrus nattereri]
MTATETETAVGHSTVSDAPAHSNNSNRSMDGSRPNFSAEERGLPGDLLESSKEFIRLYEEHQPKLQQIIHKLFMNSEEFLAIHCKAAKVKRKWGLASAKRVLGMLLSLFTCGVSVPVLGAGGVTADGERSHISHKTKKEMKNVLEEEKKHLKHFKTPADTVTSHLKSICYHVENILRYQNKQYNKRRECEHEGPRKTVEGLAQLAKLFKPVDIQRLLEQLKRTLKMTQIIKPLAHIHSLSVHSRFTFEDTNTLKGSDKLKKQSKVQKNEQESEARWLIWKMKDLADHFQNTLDEIRYSKTEIERVLIPKLNTYFLQREKCKQTD